MSHLKQIGARLSAGALSFVAALAGSDPSLAVEGAFSPYLKGSAAFLSGVLPPHEGAYFSSIYYHYDGGAGANVRNGLLERGVDMSVDAYLAQGLFVTDATILGGTYAFGAVVDHIWAEVDATLSTPMRDVAISQSADGVSDSFVWPAFLGWHEGQWHWMANLGILLPTGEYELGELSVGKNVWGLMPQVAITWFDPEAGWDVSVAFTYVTLWRNEATDYDSGDILHLDLAIGKHFGAWIVGVAGNVVEQVTGDSGTGARLGSFKAESWGLGPAITFNTKIGEAPLSVSAKWQHDFDAENTFEGDVVNLTATLVF